MTAAIVGVVALAAPARAAVVGYNFTDLDASPDTGVPVANLTVGSITNGNTLGTVATPVNASSASNVYSGASGGGNFGNAVKTGALDTSTSSYYSIVFTPSTGNAVTLTDFDFGTRSTGTGPVSYSIRSSLDGFTADLAVGTITNTSVWAFKDNTLAPVTGLPDTSLEVRVFTYAGTGSAQNGTENNRVDDISLTVSATPGTDVPEPGSAALLLGGGLFAALRRRRPRRA
jgi:hypothetical protein